MQVITLPPRRRQEAAPSASTDPGLTSQDAGANPTSATRPKEPRHPRFNRLPSFTPRRMPDAEPAFELSPSVRMAGQLDELPDEPSVRPLLRRPEWWALVGASVLAIPLIVLGSPGSRSPLAGGESSISLPGQDAEVRWAVDLSSLKSRTAAAAAIKGFFAAGTPSGKALFVRNAETVLPLMNAWYAVHEDELPSPVVAEKMMIEERHGVTFVRCTGSDATGRPFKAVLEKSGDTFLLDWRAFTGCGSMEWAVFLRDRPAGQTDLRVRAVRDDYQAGPFTGRSDVICLRLCDAADTASAWAWVATGTPGGDLIERRLPYPGTSADLRLELQFLPDQAGGRLPLLQVQSVYPDDWLDSDGTALTAQHPAGTAAAAPADPAHSVRSLETSGNSADQRGR